MGFFSGESESTAQTDPWRPAQAGLKDELRRIRGQSNWTTYDGRQQADFNGDQQRQMQGVRDYLGGYGGAMNRAMFGAGQQALGGMGQAQNYYGQAMNQGPVQLQSAQGIINNAAQFANNPYLDGQIQAAMGDVSRGLWENQMPGIAAYSAGSGNLGSSRRGVLEAGAIRDATSQAANIATQMRGNAYGQGLSYANQMAQQNAALNMQNRQNQMNAANQMTGMANMGANMMGQAQNMWGQQNQWLGNIGQQQFNHAQTGLDIARNDHYMAQMLPYQQATMGINANMGPAQAFGKTANTTPNGGTFGAIMQPIMGMAGAAMGSGMMGGR